MCNGYYANDGDGRERVCSLYFLGSHRFIARVAARSLNENNDASAGSENPSYRYGQFSDRLSALNRFYADIPVRQTEFLSMPQPGFEPGSQPCSGLHLERAVSLTGLDD